MRALTLALLLLSGCSWPIKFHPVTLPPDHEDVIWVIRGGALFRCSQPDTGPPVCAAVVWHGGQN